MLKLDPAQLDPARKLVWAWQGELVSPCTDGSPCYCPATGVLVDDAGSVTAIGGFGGTMSFGPGKILTATKHDSFLARLDPLGKLIGGVQQTGGTGGDGANTIARDKGGNLYSSGDFNGTVVFGGTTLTATGAQAVYVWKIPGPVP